MRWKTTSVSLTYIWLHMLCVSNLFILCVCFDFFYLDVLYRNNLTVVDLIMVHGQGTRESLKLAGKHPGPGSSLRFKMTEALLKDCSESECVHGLIEYFVRTFKGHILKYGSLSYPDFWTFPNNYLLPFFKMCFRKSRFFQILRSYICNCCDYVRYSLSSFCVFSTHDCGFCHTMWVFSVLLTSFNFGQSVHSLWVPPAFCHYKLFAVYKGFIFYHLFYHYI